MLTKMKVDIEHCPDLRFMCCHDIQCEDGQSRGEDKRDTNALDAQTEKNGSSERMKKKKKDAPQQAQGRSEEEEMG